jgi:hypothetical protein
MRRIAALILCSCLVSCEGNKYGDFPPFPVSGQVLINGKPAPSVFVTFYLDDYKGEKSIVPLGVTDADGRFLLSTYAVNDGAPAGDYHVSARWKPSGGGMRSSEDKLGGKYADPKSSSLTAHVDKGKTELKPFELQADESQQQPVHSQTKVFRNASGQGTGKPPAPKE